MILAPFVKPYRFHEIKITNIFLALYHNYARNASPFTKLNFKKSQKFLTTMIKSSINRSFL